MFLDESRKRGGNVQLLQKRKRVKKKPLQLYFLAAPKTLLRMIFLGEIAKVKSDLLVHQIMILKNLSGAPPT